MASDQISALLESVALERYVLRRVAPLLKSEPEEPSVYDHENDRMNVMLSVTITSGMSLAEAVERLGIRPLVFGAAWKVFDLLLEVAYEGEGRTPSKNRTRWPITEKVELATTGAGQIRPLSARPDLWRRLTAAYASTSEIRHSLTHRKADFDENRTLTSSGNDGKAGPFITQAEQIAFMRAAQWTLEALEAGAAAEREMDALMADLDQLHRLTQLPQLHLKPVEHPPAQFRVPVRSGQTVDLAHLKRRLQATSPSASQFDVTFDFGVESFRVPLERLPDEVVTLSIDLNFLRA